MAPFFSIIIATHERPELLERALLSLRQQSFGDLQIVVVADSVDTRTQAVVSRNLTGPDLFIQRSNAPGPAASRNFGVEASTGRFVIFLDDDDSFDTGYLQTLHDNLLPEEKKVYFVDFDVIDEDRSLCPPRELGRTQLSIAHVTRESTRIQNLIPNNSLVFPRAAIAGVRFDESLVLFEDWDYLLAVLERNPLEHLAIRGPIIHKNDRTLQEWPGARNDDRLAETILEIYRRHSGGGALQSARQAYFRSVGIDLPIEAFASAKRKLYLHSIAYSQETRDALEEGYMLLDNVGNERPDWREYWPIRRFLLTNVLDEEAYYGFFSPRFFEKTGLAYKDVEAFVATADQEVEVVTFSPQVDIGCFFPNVFVGGEVADPGYLLTFQEFVDRLGLGIRLDSLMLDSSRTAFSNFVIAKASYWREWLTIGEALFKLAESEIQDDPLCRQLRHKTNYREGVERKVFIMEGIASLILSRRERRRIRPYNPFILAWSAQLGQYKDEATLCDALKVAIRENGYAQYDHLYETVRQRVFQQVFGDFAKKGRPAMKQTPARDLYNDTILAMLPSSLRCVVEVGCMRGSLWREYSKHNPGCHWIGVDIDPENAAIARTVCSEALCCDIEEVADDEFLRWRDAGAWVFGDTLEHLRDPWALLVRIRKTIPDGGIVVASIPNAQHWSFQARLNVGLFRYEEEGLFDRTHLRFFTRTTIFEMFEAAGFRIVNVVSRAISSLDVAKYLPHIRAMAIASGFDPDVAEKDAMAFQYVVMAVKA